MAPRTALITGVSTGIGYSTAEALLAKGYLVFGSVRKPEDALSLQQAYGERFVPLVFDVTDMPAIETAVGKVAARLAGEGLGCLINNAGVAMGGPLQHQPWAEIRQHFDVNILGMIAVTRAFLPLLGARLDHGSAPGKILNISSVAGKVPFPFMAAYVSSKHAVEGISHSLRRELLDYGIDVIIIGPGSIYTPIWEKGLDATAYSDTAYAGVFRHFATMALAMGRHGVPSDVLGRRIAGIVEKSRPRTRYALVKGALKNYYLPRVLPDRLLDWVMRKMMG